MRKLLLTLGVLRFAINYKTNNDLHKLIGNYKFLHG